MSIELKMDQLALWILSHPDLFSTETLNNKNKSGNTALYLATYYEFTNIIDVLLKFKSIDINSINNDGDTALSRAIHKKNEIVAL